MEAVREVTGDDGFERADHRFRPLEPPHVDPMSMREKLREGRYSVDPKRVAEAILTGLGRSARPD